MGRMYLRAQSALIQIQLRRGQRSIRRTVSSAKKKTFLKFWAYSSQYKTGGWQGNASSMFCLSEIIRFEGICKKKISLLENLFACAFLFVFHLSTETETVLIPQQ